jgi:predicted DCC family thiol-disulfide oxidoreductase YuxK
MSRPEILLVYDKECPACNAYCQIVRVRESVGELKIINAREKSDIMDEITAKGLARIIHKKRRTSFNPLIQWVLRQ